MSQNKHKIIYTKTDEAPALATYSFLPVIQAFAKAAGIEVETRDISLAARIIAQFPDSLSESQRMPDALAELGDLAKTPEANIIKLPNISASIPQLKAAIKELQAKGYALPEFPDEPATPEAKDIRERYAKVLGSAVNPVLREGNSDRRVATPVKAYAQKNPHSMGDWAKDSKAHVAHMSEGDFFSNEQSHVMEKADTVRIELEKADGSTEVLKDKLALQEGEVIDATLMSCKALKAFFEQEIAKALEEDVLLSLHMKATMMKVSDPIIFGHAVKVYYRDVFEKHADTLKQIGVNPNNGIGDVYTRIETLSEDKRAEIEADLKAVYEKRPALAMVNSDKGITNLHVPSDIIIDASMPAAIRAGGKMWAPDGNLKDAKAMIPDRCYAGVYGKTIEFCKEHGAFDVSTMGNVANVGLMAQKAEEYGSHDKTFEIPVSGVVKVVDSAGNVLMKHEADSGDIWRMCQTKDAPIRDWVKLAVTRARATGAPAIFWLNESRAHDANLIKKVNAYLPEHDTSGLDIRILTPEEAVLVSLERMREGKDTISVTGNVLRDYLTDLFPILELGTSAKMLSIVPLLAGGGLFETGAGGSAPKHVQQFVEEGHLRWDSLGEFLALAVSLEDLGMKTDNQKALVPARALDVANGKYLDNNKSPSRKCGELDNRGTHFYVALYWAQALAQQDEDVAFQERFKPVSESLESMEVKVIEALNEIQGKPLDIGGYYLLDDAKAFAAMRPIAFFNEVMDALR